MTSAALRDALDGAARELGATSRAGYFSVALSAINALEKGHAAKIELLLSPLTAELARSFRDGLGAAVDVLTDMSRVRLSDKFLLPAISLAVIVQDEVSDLPEAAQLVTQGSGSSSRAIFVVGDDTGTDMRAALAVPPDIHLAAVPSRERIGPDPCKQFAIWEPDADTWDMTTFGVRSGGGRPAARGPWD